MSKRKKRFRIHPKYVYIFLTILCFVLVVLSFKYSDSFVGVKTTLGNIVTPMQKGIDSVGRFLSDKMDFLSSKEDLLEENRALKEKIDELSYDNKILAGENSSLENFRELYKLDKKYPDYLALRP